MNSMLPFTTSPSVPIPLHPTKLLVGRNKNFPFSTPSFHRLYASCATSILRTYPNKIFRRFSGLFWPIFDSFIGGHIRSLILPPKKESKIGSKEPENRLKLFSER